MFKIKLKELEKCTVFPILGLLATLKKIVPQPAGMEFHGNFPFSTMESVICRYELAPAEKMYH